MSKFKVAPPIGLTGNVLWDLPDQEAVRLQKHHKECRRFCERQVEGKALDAFGDEVATVQALDRDDAASS